MTDGKTGCVSRQLTTDSPHISLFLSSKQSQALQRSDVEAPGTTRGFNRTTDRKTGGANPNLGRSNLPGAQPAQPTTDSPQSSHLHNYVTHKVPRTRSRRNTGGHDQALRSRDRKKDGLERTTDSEKDQLLRPTTDSIYPPFNRTPSLPHLHPLGHRQSKRSDQRSSHQCQTTGH